MAGAAEEITGASSCIVALTTVSHSSTFKDTSYKAPTVLIPAATETADAWVVDGSCHPLGKVDEDILGFEIAVHDAVHVRMGHRLEHLMHDDLDARGAK